MRRYVQEGVKREVEAYAEGASTLTKSVNALVAW
jgi:hypothetical protein